MITASVFGEGRGLRELAVHEHRRAERDLAELAATPIVDTDQIRRVLYGWSDEFVDLCCSQFKRGEIVEFDVSFPDPRDADRFRMPDPATQSDYDRGYDTAIGALRGVDRSVIERYRDAAEREASAGKSQFHLGRADAGRAILVGPIPGLVS